MYLRFSFYFARHLLFCFVEVRNVVGGNALTNGTLTYDKRFIVDTAIACIRCGSVFDVKRGIHLQPIQYHTLEAKFYFRRSRRVGKVPWLPKIKQEKPFQHVQRDVAQSTSTIQESYAGWRRGQCSISSH